MVPFWDLLLPTVTLPKLMLPGVGVSCEELPFPVVLPGLTPLPPLAGPPHPHRRDVASARTIKVFLGGIGNLSNNLGIFCPVARTDSRAPKGMDEYPLSGHALVTLHRILKKRLFAVESYAYKATRPAKPRETRDSGQMAGGMHY